MFSCQLFFSTTRWELSFQWWHHSKTWPTTSLRSQAESIKWPPAQEWIVLKRNVYALYKIKMTLAAPHLSFPAECGMRDAVHVAALIFKLPLASHRPRCSPINNYSITMHPTSHSCWNPPHAGRKEEGEVSKEVTDGWYEHMTARDVSLEHKVKIQCQRKGRCNEGNPIVLKVNSFFSPPSKTPALIQIRKLISSPIKPHY